MLRIRFQAYVNEGLVTLSLRDGEQFSHHTGGPHDEGYSYSSTTWSREGDIIQVEYYTRSRDCDGPIEYHAVYVANTFDHERKPEWRKDSESQRDVYAESMNY